MFIFNVHFQLEREHARAGERVSNKMFKLEKKVEKARA
jgi:hypothetical protein